MTRRIDMARQRVILAWEIVVKNPEDEIAWAFLEDLLNTLGSLVEEIMAKQAA